MCIWSCIWFHLYSSHLLLNPFCPADFSILINWPDPFPNLGVSGVLFYYAPPPESGRVLCYTLQNFECPSVCLSVRPSVSAHHHSCIGNSSYSFRPILLKLYRCFKDGLKICILFFQNPEIIFYHFFPIFNLDIFRALILQICIWSMYLVSATPPTVFGESFWNFTGVLRMVWRYAYCFFRILNLFFITFFAFLT